MQFVREKVAPNYGLLFFVAGCGLQLEKNEEFPK